MLKRVTWFAVGTVTGAVGAAWAYTQVREARGRAVADQLADRVVGASRQVGGRVRDAVNEGVQTMRETHAELEASSSSRFASRPAAASQPTRPK